MQSSQSKTLLKVFSFDSCADYDPVLDAYKSFSISKNLYGNDLMSAFELAKVFSKPFSSKPINNVVPDEIKILLSNQMPVESFIIHSEAFTEPSPAVGDSFQVFQKKYHDKRAIGPVPSLFYRLTRNIVRL